MTSCQEGDNRGCENTHLVGGHGKILLSGTLQVSVAPGSLSSASSTGG